MTIIYVDDPKNCEFGIGDFLNFKDDFRPPIIITGIRKREKEPVRRSEYCTCPHCGGDLDDYMDT